MRRGREKRPDSRLPLWTWSVIAAGGVLAYLGVGSFLLGARFEFETLWLSSEDVTQTQAEALAPFVLLLIPAVLGALWTRETLRLIYRGLRRGDRPAAIAKEVVLFALSYVVLVLVALTSRSKQPNH